MQLRGRACTQSHNGIECKTGWVFREGSAVTSRSSAFCCRHHWSLLALLFLLLLLLLLQARVSACTPLMTLQPPGWT